MASREACDETARESFPTGSNADEPAAPQALVRTLAARAGSRGERALLVVEMPLARRPSREAAGAGDGADRADRLAARLGTENACLVHDTRAGLDPALLAAEIGTVPAGGGLVLLVPPIAEPDRTLADGGGERPSRFVARFHRHLLEHLEREPATSARISLPSGAQSSLGALYLPLGESHGRRAGLSEQDVLLERLSAHLDHGTHALAVIEAPRGHGKSALLGRLAARLEGARRPYRVSAVRRTAVTVLDRHRRRALASGGHAGNGLFDPRAPLPFLAPDAALAGRGERLLVDEAASLPLPVLARLLGRYRRIVLATTTQGHESAGRAFALRLPAVLDRERPGWLRLTPAVPLRWRAGDPLDALTRRALLPRTVVDDLADRHAPMSGVEPPPDACEIDRDALARDERRLDALTSLLAATHYQSTPLDLAYLLDAPLLRLWSIERGDDLLGAALVAIEPGIELALHAEVLARRRRLPHRLLPQLLAQSADRADALDADFARVIRIAVHPDVRRLGLGSHLVAALVHGTADTVEAVGASFGETPSSCAFWSANGFTTFHRGFRRNPRSGQRSVAVLRAGSSRTATVLGVAASIHSDNVGAIRAVDAARFDPDSALTSGGAERGHGTLERLERLPARDRALLRRFARGERSLSDSLGALRRLAGIAASTDIDEDVARLSRRLRPAGAEQPPSRRQREAALRGWIGERLAAQRLTSTSSPTSVLPKPKPASQ